MRIVGLLLFVLLGQVAIGQRVRLPGLLRDSLTLYPLKGVLTNLTTGQQVQTTNNGSFLLPANPGHRIVARANGYRSDTLVIPGMYADTLNFFLVPTGIILGNVTVQSQYTRYQLDSIERRRTFDSLRGNTVPTVSKANELGFGVGISLDKVFKSKYRRQREQELLFERRERDAFINSYFTPQLVAGYTGLKGEGLRDFMSRYRPEYEWLRRNYNHDALLVFINDSLKDFRKQP